MVRLSVVRSQKGFETLAATLRDQILDGSVKPGEVLPNEREMVERTGLSRGSVREAFRVLEAEGLVSTRLGRNGGRVSMKSNNEAVRRSLEFFIRGHRIAFPVLIETVEVLEPSLAQLAAIHRNDEDIAALRAESKKLQATKTPGRFVSANAKWHQAMARASHNPILTTIYESLGPDLLNPHVAGFVSEEIRAAVVVAVSRVEDAIVAGDPEAARRRMVRHVLAYRAKVEQVAPKLVKL